MSNSESGVPVVAESPQERTTGMRTRNSGGHTFEGRGTPVEVVETIAYDRRPSWRRDCTMRPLELVAGAQEHDGTPPALREEGVLVEVCNQKQPH